jgi:hypothetical protein
MTINKLEPKAIAMIISGEAEEAWRRRYELINSQIPIDEYTETLMLAAQMALNITKNLLMEAGYFSLQQ